jgi:Protein of unknown function (DUF3142).
MSAKFRLSVLFLIFTILLVGCRTKTVNQVKPNPEAPKIILWAWERHENLRFLDAEKYGVAFIAQRLFLREDEVVFHPRRQPLEINPDVYLIAVTRIETDRTRRPSFSETQKKQTIELIAQTLRRPNVKALQLDFDALVSERNFYKSLVRDLRAKIAENVPLTVTALASWCAGDTWLNDLPIDEAVPMAFRMGADDKAIRDFLEKGNDWREPLCRGSYGIALDEPLKMNFRKDRRFFLFKNEAWKAEDLQKLPEGIS